MKAVKGRRPSLSDTLRTTMTQYNIERGQSMKCALEQLIQAIPGQQFNKFDAPNDFKVFDGVSS